MPRKKNGQFSAGESGNPTGRPSTQAAAIRKQLAAHSEAIIQVVTNAALSGDLTACKMILERLSPPLKAQSAPVTIDLPPEKDMAQIALAFIKAAAEGAISPDVATQMVSTVAQFAHITEIKNQLTEEEPIFTGFVFNVVDGKGNVTKTVRQEIEVPEILYPKKQ